MTTIFRIDVKTETLKISGSIQTDLPSSISRYRLGRRDGLLLVIIAIDRSARRLRRLVSARRLRMSKHHVRSSHARNQSLRRRFRQNRFEAILRPVGVGLRVLRSSGSTASAIRVTIIIGELSDFFRQQRFDVTRREEVRVDR